MKEILGIDIGGVIINNVIVNGRYARMPNTFEVIRNLKQKRFGNNMVIVSRADMEGRLKVIRWLGEERFYKETGMKLSQVLFCEDRTQKADICLEKGVTHFIDDRKEIMCYLRRVGIKNLYLFQGRQDEAEGIYDHVLPDVVQVASWLEVQKHLLG